MSSSMKMFFHFLLLKGKIHVIDNNSSQISTDAIENDDILSVESLLALGPWKITF